MDCFIQVVHPYRVIQSLPLSTVIPNLVYRYVTLGVRLHYVALTLMLSVKNNILAAAGSFVSLTNKGHCACAKVFVHRRSARFP